MFYKDFDALFKVELLRCVCGSRTMFEVYLIHMDDNTYLKIMGHRLNHRFIPHNVDGSK